MLLTVIADDGKNNVFNLVEIPKVGDSFKYNEKIHKVKQVILLHHLTAAEPVAELHCEKGFSLEEIKALGN